MCSEVTPAMICYNAKLKTEISKRLGKKLQIWYDEIMTTKGRKDLWLVANEGGGGRGKGEVKNLKKVSIRS